MSDEKFRAEIKAMMPFDWVTVRGADAFDEWSRLKAAGRGYPIVVGSDDDLENLAEGYEINQEDDVTRQGYDVQRVLEAAAGLSIPDDLPDYDPKSETKNAAKDEEWPDDVSPSPELAAAVDISTGEFHDRVHILLVPAQASWEVPAYLRFGGWNACPYPAVHVAALRFWHERYGVELVGLGSDTMNLLGTRTPATRQEALELAYAQYCYCGDIVDQGVETISALAASLMASKWWYFWWD